MAGTDPRPGPPPTSAWGSGTGKSTTIKQLLQSIQREKKKLLDLCYVYNFRTPELPICLSLPAGDGVAFKKRMAEVLKTLIEHVPKALESEAFLKRKKDVVTELKELQPDGRNTVGDHFNWDAADISDQRVVRFGEATLELANLLICEACGGMAVRVTVAALSAPRQIRPFPAWSRRGQRRPRCVSRGALRRRPARLFGV